jgi:hypothetical protein
MIQFILMIVIGIVIFTYGLNLLNELKDEDENKNAKRFGYAILITAGVILVSIGIYEIVVYNRLSSIRRIPSLPELPRFSPFSSPINRTANV